ncbi:MAG: MBL fold metallo-hydrolase [Candidatus Thorarchaeota archaeon]|jgi:glyoxylase-like metal-dependent hydrolase (beta-lactamase superfamily II)
MSKMEFDRMGRNLAVIFQDPFPTTTHLIFGEHRVYVCDTFLGPKSMDKISDIIFEKGAADKPVVVFNSHADWDHIWGNCYFKDSMILAHEHCRIRIQEEGESGLEKNEIHKQGEVVITPPTVTFGTNYIFEDDEVEFFYSPGHTIDSASCYDHKEKILFVGDNVESDVPYVNSLDFDTYISTLEGYIERFWEYMVCGHDPVQSDDKLVKKNLEYLIQFKEWNVDLGSITPRAQHVHFHSLNNLVNEILQKGIQNEVRNHYLEAISILENKDSNEHVTEYLDQYKRVTE